MTVRNKISIAIVLITISVILVGIKVISPLHRELLSQIILKSSESLAERQMDTVDRLIEQRVEHVKTSAVRIAGSSDLIESNAAFDALPNVNAFITGRDLEWTSNGTELVNDVLSNSLSKLLTDHFQLKDYYIRKYGYAVFPEAFITNKYGAVVGMTNKTTDYNQADEDWWNMAKTRDTYIGDVEFDESSQTYSTSINVTIRDNAENFLGVFRVILTLENIDELMDQYKNLDRAVDTNVFLLDKNLRVIYPKDTDTKLAERIITEFKNYLSGEIIPENRSFSNTCLNNQEKCTFTFARSTGYKEVTDMGWTILIEHPERILFQPLNKSTAITLYSTAGLVIAAFSVFMWILTTASRQLFDIAEVIKEVSLGNYKARVPIKVRDEMGIIGEKFNLMLEKWQKLNYLKIQS